MPKQKVLYSLVYHYHILILMLMYMFILVSVSQMMQLIKSIGKAR